MIHQQPLKRLVLTDPDWHEAEGNGMEFRLTYDGPLLGASRSNTRADHKQEIRKHFHPQLRELWRVHPFLHSLSTSEHYSNKEWRDIGRHMGKNKIEEKDREIGPPWLQRHADSFERGGIRFAPLVTENLEILCSLSILFLRPGSRGALLNSGDIDNRLKTLFDALRMPANKDEMPGLIKSEEFDPFFVLLEDDRLITQVSVETDVLLQSTSSNPPDPNDCRLVIKVDARPYAPVRSRELSGSGVASAAVS